MRALPWLKISPLPLFLPVPLLARDHSSIMKLFVIAASIAAASAVTQGQATAAITDLSQAVNVANVGTENFGTIKGEKGTTTNFGADGTITQDRPKVLQAVNVANVGTGENEDEEFHYRMKLFGLE